MIPIETDGPFIVMRFYYRETLLFLTWRDHAEIHRRLHDVPRTLRLSELAPHISSLGESGAEATWQVLRNYLDVLETKIAEIVHRHSPSFWIHLHRRIKPMLSSEHTGKTDEITVHLVRQIAELAYAKHGDINNRDDLGPIIGMRLKTFMDGAWYEAAAKAVGSKLKAQKEFCQLKFSEQVVMTNFRASDLHDVYGIEGLCYEYWWASAVMRSIGKGSPVRWQNDPPRVLYCDQPVHPLCFEIYDGRINQSGGFYTRTGTWTNAPQEGGKEPILKSQDQIFFAQIVANAEPEEYPAWNPQTKAVGRAYGPINFHMGSFPLAKFRSDNAFMAAPFEKKHGVSFDAVMFAVWTAAFYGVFSGFTAMLSSPKDRLARTVSNWTNLLFRGYSVTPLTLPQLAKEAVHWAKTLKLNLCVDEADALKGLNFIALSPPAQVHIGLWSGGKRPILIPSFEGLVIDLAAIMPFLYTIFFGLRKVDQLGGIAFEDAVRDGIRGRGLDICHKGLLNWTKVDYREVDAAVRLGDRLILVECFTYELPLDYEIGKPSVFDVRKGFILDKIKQAESLAQRLAAAPKGTNFDFSWAKTIEWRVVSPFVEFAWQLNEPFIDADGVPRIMQAQELLEYLDAGTNPISANLSLLKKVRAVRESPPHWH